MSGDKRRENSLKNKNSHHKHTAEFNHKQSNHIKHLKQSYHIDFIEEDFEELYDLIPEEDDSIDEN